MPDPWDTPTKKIHPLVDCNVSEIVKNAAGIHDLDTLELMRESEAANQNRVSALEAIDARIEKVKAIVSSVERGAPAKKPKQEEPSESNEDGPTSAVYVTRSGEKFAVEYGSLSELLASVRVCIAHNKSGRGVVIPYDDGHVIIAELDHVQLSGTNGMPRNDLLVRI